MKKKSLIDDDLIGEHKQEKKEVDPSCTFCLYKTGKLSKDELRVMWDLHVERDIEIHCPKCNEKIKF